MDMPPPTALDLTQDLFQLMKHFPRPKLTQGAHDELTRSEYELLVMLMMAIPDEKKALSVSEISALLQISPAGVTHLLNPLEAAKLIQRRPDPRDRRVVLIGLTKKGAGIAAEALAEAQAKLIGLVEYLGAEDSQTLIRLMSRAIEFFKVTAQVSGDNQ